MTKSTDVILPKLIHECVRDIGLAILIGLALMVASVANAKSINPTLQFQQSIQHAEYNRLAYVILTEAYRRIGHPVRPITENPYNKSSVKIQKSSMDGVLIAPANKELDKQYIRIPVALIQLKVFAYAHKSQGNTVYEFGLLGNRVAIVEGMPIIENSMAGMVVVRNVSINKSFKSVLRNQADLVLLPELLALSRSKKHLRKQVVALQPAVYEVPMYHYVSKSNKHLVKSIASSIKKMEKQQMISHVTQSFKNVLAADSEA